LSTIDLVDYGGFTLLTGVSGQAWLDAADKVSDKLAVPITGYAIGLRTEYDDVSLAWTRIRDFADDGCVLLRPDRHIAFRAEHLTGDPEVILQQILATLLAHN
jgi:2,4-dichlorophenol 6-monooxygenase